MTVMPRCLVQITKASTSGFRDCVLFVKALGLHAEDLSSGSNIIVGG